jgi:hypothetical protein
LHFTYKANSLIDAPRKTRKSQAFAAKRLSATSNLILRQVENNANSRFAIQSWKSPRANAENPGAGKNQGKSQKQNQTQLRETRGSATEAWAELDVAI